VCWNIFKLVYRKTPSPDAVYSVLSDRILGHLLNNKYVPYVPWYPAKQLAWTSICFTLSISVWLLITFCVDVMTSISFKFSEMVALNWNKHENVIASLIICVPYFIHISLRVYFIFIILKERFTFITESSYIHVKPTKRI